MSYKVKLLPIAHSDLRKAKKSYQDKNEILAEEFKLEVNKEIDYIAKISTTLSTKTQKIKTIFSNSFSLCYFLFN